MTGGWKPNMWWIIWYRLSNQVRDIGNKFKGFNGPLARYIKLRVAHAPGIPGAFSPPPWDSDPDVHHGTCVTHVPWCMSGSLTSGFYLNSVTGENAPGIPGACANCNVTYLARGPWIDSLMTKCSLQNIRRPNQNGRNFADDNLILTL